MAKNRAVCRGLTLPGCRPTADTAGSKLHEIVLHRATYSVGVSVRKMQVRSVGTVNQAGGAIVSQGVTMLSNANI